MVQSEGVATRIELEGDFDVAEVPRLQRMLSRAERSHLVVLDMSKLTYLDSSALGCLVTFYKALHRYGGDVYLTGVPPRVRRILEITNLSEIFPELD